MADQLQLRGGTTAEHSTFTGALREVTVDTDKDVLVVHDNSTAGGHPLMAEDGSNSALALGSAGTPSLKFTGDTNTGVFSPTADTVGVSTGGSERARIDSNGRLLVGTTSDSFGTSAIFQGNSADATSNAHVRLCVGTATPADGASLGRLGFGDSAHIAAAEVRSSRDGGTWSASSLPTRLQFFTCADGTSSSTERMRIDSSGRVGIGTTSPGATLHVQGSGDEIFRINTTNAGGPYCAFQTNGTNFLFLGSAAQLASGGATDSCIRSQNNLILTSGGATERARIDSSGRLLVGASSTTWPYRIVAQGGVGFSAGSLAITRAQAGSAITSGGDIGYLSFGGNDNTTFAQISAWADATTGSNDYPGRLVFSTTADGASSPTERMRISANGRIDCFSSNTSNGYIFTVSGGASSVNNLFLLRHSSTGFGTGTSSFVVTTNGNVYNTNNSYGAISDAKLKENIVDAASQWDDLKAIQVRKYNFKEETGKETHTQIGVVAQEVELVSPGLVTESPDIDEEGNDLGTVTKSVNYSVLYMKAVKALQEAMERIETLEAKVSALEAN